MKIKTQILSSILGVILFIILVIVLMNRPNTSPLEQEQNNYNEKTQIQQEKLQENELLRQNMIDSKQKIDINTEEVNKLEQEKDCIKQNIENILEGLEKKPCEEITAKKKTIVLKK